MTSFFFSRVNLGKTGVTAAMDLALFFAASNIPSWRDALGSNVAISLHFAPLPHLPRLSDSFPLSCV